MKTRNKFWYNRYKENLLYIYIHRNILSKLIAKSKSNHLSDFFQKHCQNLKKKKFGKQN